MRNKQYFLILLAFLFWNGSSTAQDYSNSFSWVGTNTNLSQTGAYACGVQNVITLRSTPSTHSPSGSSVIFPSVTGTDNNPTISITLTFKSPVCNLRLKVNDIDQGPGTIAAETVVTTPAFSSIAPSIIPGGPTFVGVGATTLSPAGNDNTLGWVSFDGPLTTVTLRYNRPGIGYGLLLDSLTFDCCDDCICDSKDNKLNATANIPNSGATSAGLSISSDGQPISKLNISLPYYTSLANPDCIKCDPANISSYGKITNLPTIAGVAPTAVGFSSDGAAEIVYDFSTPTVINHSISLDLQFPPTLDLSCCPNSVDYCIKLGMIDKDCKICEKLLCLKTPASSSSSSSTGSSRNHILQPKADQIGEATAPSDMNLILHPNPTEDLLHVTLPSENHATLEVLDINGKVIQTTQVQSKQTKLNVSALSQGVYLIKYVVGGNVITEQFIKQ